MQYESISEKQRLHWKRLAQENAGSVRAVGSESIVHKHLRYQKISALFETETQFSVHDVGAGIGDFFEYLRMRTDGGLGIRYSASEITPEYCAIALSRFPGVSFCHRDILVDRVDDRYDYVVLSGVFHQNGDVTRREWARYRNALLEKAWLMARRGIAFNCLSHHADFHKAGNYYADLAEIQGFIVGTMSRFFQVDHAYPLFEATFCVFKPDWIRSRYPAPILARYLAND